MKLTEEKLAELKALASIPYSAITGTTALDLLADLEEAQRMIAVLTPDALREAEERKSIAAGLESVWKGRMQDAETAHRAELAGVRQQLSAQKTELYEQQKYIIELESELRSNAHKANSDIASLEQKLFTRSQELAATRQQLEDANDSIYKLNQDYKMATQLAASYLNELHEVRQQLAEAQALVYLYRDALCDGPENMSNARAEDLEQKACDGTALQSAIAAAVEPYKRDADQWRQQLAEAHAFIQSISDQLPEKPDNWSSCSQCQSNSASAEDFLGGVK